MRRWIIQCKYTDTNEVSFMSGGVYNDLDMAKRDADQLNTIIGDRRYHYSVIELIDVVEIRKADCDMTDEERQERFAAIREIEADLQNGILCYDEWSAREYGEDKLDVYDTAEALYNAGYRKVKEMKYE